eukprot:CAMPEP_0179029578 /NCGR_PEP_ID=MMETSP0796-20121207/10129_1 /TAXON_ID=73915 /ORGANISM="Pyrodinium bahamense, Strain pbaha01" /LENGTH=56 /DNA_ID=CAMNT_0020725747 /DNA_START=12 /DNA_END=179 /DNA_ORIENTATION=-
MTASEVKVTRRAEMRTEARPPPLSNDDVLLVSSWASSQMSCVEAVPASGLLAALSS